MKTFKRFSAILIAVLMMVSMMIVPASAAENNENTPLGSITINNTVSNVTYSVYKIFDVVTIGTEGENATESFYYKPTENWKNFFAEDANGAFYGSIGTNGYIAWENENLFNYGTDGIGTDAQKTAIAAFAAYAASYAKSISSDKSVVSDGVSLTISGLDENGYYLVVSSLGANAIAGPVTTDGFTINEKNSITEAPTITKTVGDGRTEMSVNFGEEFTYTIIVSLNENIPENSLTLTDIVPKQIHVLENSLSVTKKNGDTTYNLTKGTDYTVTRGDATSGLSALSDETTYTHTVSFSSAFNTGDTLTFKYKAKLVDSTDNPLLIHELYTNLAEISYGATSVSDTASVFTLGAFGHKYYINSQTLQETPLEGAGFVLRNSENKYYKLSDAKDKVTWVEDVDAATIISSGSDGNFEFYGIAAGTYFLVEKVVPEGYTGITSPVSITVNRTVATSTARIENVKGTSQLPSTGGIGTPIFYGIGGVLVIGALSLLIVRKRTTAK